MQLTPRYGGEPVISLDGAPADIAGPAIRQRLRLAATLATLTDEQWAHPSRCAGWSTRDVIVHLDTTNTFWSLSIEAGLRGEPTRFLADFDPVATPAQMVAADDVPPGEALDRFTRSTRSLVDLWSSLDTAAWMTLAEAPPGHLSVSVLTHHALWDSWVHERDISLPLGRACPEEADEVAACLRYVAALSPAFAVNNGTAGRGVLAVDVVDPEVSFVVEADDDVRVRSGAGEADLRLEGRAVDLLEALSIRRPLDRAIPPSSAWMVGGLAEVFDVEPA